MDLLDGDVELTEFEAIEVESIKGVGQGANGFPILMMKGLAAAKAPMGEDGSTEGPAHTEKSALDIAVKAVTGGKIDEAPDIALGHQIMGLLAQAIQAEAQEIGAGSYGEVCDVDLLNCAASMISRWIGREASPGDDDSSDMGMLMASAAIKAAMSAKDINDLPDSAFAYIEDGGEKDSEGKTTPRSKRHFPVHDKAHADNAAARIAQGAKFGDQAKAKVEAAQKKFGEDTSKSAVAEGEGTVDTVTQGTGDLEKIVENAVAKAVKPHEERVANLESANKSLEAELAKVKALPVPGGPVLSRNVQVKQAGAVVQEDWAAKAAYYRDMAEQVTDRATADGYRKLAREADAKAVTPSS